MYYLILALIPWNPTMPFEVEAEFTPAGLVITTPALPEGHKHSEVTIFPGFLPPSIVGSNKFVFQSTAREGLFYSVICTDRNCIPVQASWEATGEPVEKTLSEKFAILTVAIIISGLLLGLFFFLVNRGWEKQ